MEETSAGKTSQLQSEIIASRTLIHLYVLLALKKGKCQKGFSQKIITRSSKQNLSQTASLTQAKYILSMFYI